MNGDIVIVGDGWAAWSAAVGLACGFHRMRAITVVPAAIADPLTITTDMDATRWFGLIGIDLRMLLAEAEATFRLGSAIADDGRKGFVPVADHAPRAGELPFDQLGLGPRAAVDPLASLARAGRMMRSPQDHGFHLSLVAYTALLRRRALSDGVVRASAHLVGVDRADDGDIAAILLADGNRVTANLFVDATDGTLTGAGCHGAGGPRLIRTVKDQRAVASVTGPAMTSVAVTPGVGWSTVVPLRRQSVTIEHRFGQSTHRLARAWHGNVLAIGGAFGILDGAEGGDWALVQKGVTQLVQLLPAGRATEMRRHEYNRRMTALHDQWAAAVALRQRRAFPEGGVASAALDGRITLYAATGRLPASDDLAVPDVAWRMLFGVHGIAAPTPHPLAPDDVAAMLPQWRSTIAAMIAQSPPHASLLDHIDPR